MHLSIGSNQKLISSNCFRLLSLVPEVQNDVEVMKPVLCELEVMRLSCSLGMMSSVNAKDFEMEMLEAREFDDDFVLFLRKEIFGANGNRTTNNVKVISLFGKQDAVKHELDKLNCWSDEVNNNLKMEDQGIYCIAQRNDEAGVHPLVLFGWIQDRLFQKDQLRGIATYVLRFLTCLSPNMVCCLSPEDVKVIEQAVASMNSNNLDAWKSFSVAFHVRRQEKEKDAVGCKNLPDVGLPTTSMNQHVQMIKGSYPALIVVDRAPAATFNKSLLAKSSTIDEFAHWLLDESSQHNVKVELATMDCDKLLDKLLRDSGRWPEAKVKGINDMKTRSLGTLADETKDQVQMHIEEHRAKLLECIDKLFDLDVLFAGAKDEPVFATIHKYMEDIKTNRGIWSKLDRGIRDTLNFPLRLKNQMKNIALAFRDQEADCPIDEVRQTLETFMRELTVSDAKVVASRIGIFGRVWRSLGFVKDEHLLLLTDQFRMCMVGPLNEARQTWFEAVEVVGAVARSELCNMWSEEKRKSIVQTCQDDICQAIHEAGKDLLSNWQTQHTGNLMTTIHPRVRGELIYCDVQKELWKPATDQVTVLKLIQKEGEAFTTRQLGTHRMNPDAKFLQAFTIKNQCMVLITSSPQGTLVERVDFPVCASSFLSCKQEGNVTFTRQFGRAVSLCDFNVHERVIALVEGGGRVVLYRFNDTFLSLEIYKRVDLSLRTSLAFPVADVLLVDDLLYATDTNGSIQSVNLKNQQTSRAGHLLPSGSCAAASTLFAMADNAVLGCMSAKVGNGGLAELVAVASEDFRNIPVTFSAGFRRKARCLSVQCFNNLLFVVDEVEKKIHVVELVVTVRSELFRIEHSKEHSVNGTKTEGDEGDAVKVDHWFRAFYHSYEKFPVRGLIRGVDDTRDTLKLQLVCSSALTQSMEDDCRFFFRVLMRDLRKLNKPLGGMDLARDLAVTTDLNASMADIAPRPVRSLLQDLITFVPIQICRAEGNSLTVMTDGRATPMGNQSQSLQAVDIARSIRFGLLSPLLESWQGRCVVITSMGKQSTGKSYLLNHLTGSSFAIAGARCTDGAWMTIRILPKHVLLIVLDFEGLGSFERTEQEDVFLSVLNASISMFTIFRMEMRFDKEIEDLFARFQKGVALIKGDPSLFRGKLYMSVKDVNPNDQKGVLDEIIRKLDKLVGPNKANNFLLDLYSGQLDINCSPPLGTTNYYQSLIHAQTFVEKSLCGVDEVGFQSGKTFLNGIRLVLAKISILDWTSLDEGAKQFQLSEVSSKLSGLLRTGCMIPQESVAKTGDVAAYLKEDILLAGGKVIDVNMMTLIAEYPPLGDKWRSLSEKIDLDSLPDWEIDLGIDCNSASENAIVQVDEALKQLFRLFLLNNSSIRNGKLPRDIVVDFDAFVAFITRRRKARIVIWVKQMLGGRAPDEWKNIEQQYLGRFLLLLTRCQSDCDNCRLGCMKSAAHSGSTSHNCGGNHVCSGRCEYCESTEHFGKTPSCSKEAGHEGRCECNEGDHTCGQDCCMINSPNCGKKCSLKRGHVSLHQCDVPIHMCGEECSAKHCSGRCILNVEEVHTVHKCVEMRCMQKCIMDGCNELCGTMDHFHGQVDVAVVFSVENGSEKGSSTFDAASEAPVVHMCGHGHECQAMCDENGICRVDVFLKQSSRTFTGARGKFQFTFQEMNDSRKKCSKRLLPNQKMHQGAHTCVCVPNDDNKKGEETIHYCDVRCPCCSYFCKKKFGHFDSHTTSHGNMRNTYFLSDAEEIDIEERKYKAGESGTAEMCNLYCSKMGREHIHYLDCEQGDKNKCVYTSIKDQRRHCTRSIEPKPDKEMDEVLHEQFWKTLGWEDPCTSKMELELFGKCGFKCDAPDHIDKPSYCTLSAWHNPVTKPRTGFDGFTYVSGHQFECSHVSSGGKMHHVFVLDCSGSMSGQPWIDLMAAWKEYVYNRIADGASLDLMSVVTFSSHAQIEYEARNITTLTNAPIRYHGGGTNYAAGLRTANEVLSRVNFESYKPVVVFFSDGQPCDPLQGEELAAHIKYCYEKNGLAAFAVGFGSINLNVLERVAEKMGGTYHNVLTGNELKTTFFSISASLNSRTGLALAKPDHERNCVICKQDLASGATIKLEKCGHELHHGCLNVLIRNAQDDEETARCPSCRREIT